MAKPNTLVRDAAVGAMILAAILLLGYMAAKIGTVGGYRNGRSITMVFEDATGLVETAPVAISGVKIGTVYAIDYADGGARVKARIRPDVALYADAIAQVRAKSLLGEKFVGLDPGHETAGPLPADGKVQTTPAGDIDRMAAAFARAAEKLDPDDVKAIVHGLAVALNENGGAASKLPSQITQVAADLHTLALSLQNVSGESSDVLKQAKPVLVHLDQQLTKVGATLDDLQPSIHKLPNTMDHLERASARIDALLEKADKLDKEELKRDLRQILEEEGVYVRMRPRKIGKGGKPEPDEDEKAPAPTPLPGLQR